MAPASQASGSRCGPRQLELRGRRSQEIERTTRSITPRPIFYPRFFASPSFSSPDRAGKKSGVKDETRFRSKKILPLSPSRPLRPSVQNSLEQKVAKSAKAGEQLDPKLWSAVSQHRFGCLRSHRWGECPKLRTKFQSGADTPHSKTACDPPGGLQSRSRKTGRWSTEGSIPSQAS